MTALTISSGTLSPAFSSATQTYTASVGNTTTSINVTATVETGAQLYINSALQTSGTAKAVSLNVGSNTITIATKISGVTRNYTLTVHRAANVNLSALSTSPGTLSPAFAAGTTSYTVTLNTLATSISVTATPADTGATVKINGTSKVGTNTVSVPISAGSKFIPVEITGWDGVTKKTYTINIKRPTGLKALTINNGTLIPDFDRETLNYTVDVIYPIDSLDITATLEYSAISQLYINKDKQKSGSPKTISLDVGVNQIKIDTKIDDIVRTYRITVNRSQHELPQIKLYNLDNGQIGSVFSVRQSDITPIEFAFKVTQADYIGDKSMQGELYIGVNDVYQRVTDFTVNGVLNTTGELIIENEAEYVIKLNKNLYVPVYADEFMIKIVAKDVLDGEGIMEIKTNQVMDILAQWSLDSAQDNIVLDSSGQNKNGVIQGADLTVGLLSNGLIFDGVDDYVSIPKASFNNLSAWSFEAWVRPEGHGYLYSEGNPSETLVIEMKEDNSINIRTWNQGKTWYWNSFNTGPNILTRNKWNHIVVTLNNGTSDRGIVNCYINGTLVKTGILGSESNLDTKYAAIGGNIGYKSGKGLHSFQGCIDEVTLYGYSLDVTDIEKKYQNVILLENVKITDSNGEKTKQGSIGTYHNKLEFDLNKPVDKLVLELSLPSNIKVISMEKLYLDGTEILNADVTIENNKITLEHAFVRGHYHLELLLNMDQQFIIKTKSFSDENRISTNYESEEFKFEFMDLESLPGIR